MLSALSVAGIVGIIVGTLAAAMADVFPAHRAALQDWGSGLLVGSVALLALTFPLI